MVGDSDEEECGSKWSVRTCGGSGKQALRCVKHVLLVQCSFVEVKGICLHHKACMPPSPLLPPLPYLYSFQLQTFYTWCCECCLPHCFPECLHYCPISEFLLGEIRDNWISHCLERNMNWGPWELLGI